MTSLLERIVAILAPHVCVVCSNENNILCELCAWQLCGMAESLCVVCGAYSVDSATCTGCWGGDTPDYVWVAGDYEAELAEVIRLFKFEGVRAAAGPLSKAVAGVLPALPDDMVVVPLPTALNRVRQRGYDQAYLLAWGIGKETGCDVVQLLHRRQDSRQLGAGREQRFAQAKEAYGLAKADYVAGRHVLLVDDVMTTGASLRAATELLRGAGAASVNAVVVARQADS